MNADCQPPRGGGHFGACYVDAMHNAPSEAGIGTVMMNLSRLPKAIIYEPRGFRSVIWPNAELLPMVVVRSLASRRLL